MRASGFGLALGCGPHRRSGALDGFDEQPGGTARNAARTRAAILEAGCTVFAEHGYSGAKVSAIVALAGTTKPMVYYHFGSKEGLFAAVLETVYAGMRACEEALRIGHLPPLDAMRTLVGATFDYHARHPDWVRLIAVANIHHAQHIKGSATIATRNSAIVGMLAGLLRRGAEGGVFRAGVDPLHLHLLINSFCFYRISNRHTWRVIFGRDLLRRDEAAGQRAMVVDAVLTFLGAGAGAIDSAPPPGHTDP